MITSATGAIKLLLINRLIFADVIVYIFPRNSIPLNSWKPWSYI